MPWSKSNRPEAFKNLSGKSLEIAIEVANSVLEDTGDESQAIASGLSQAEEFMEKSLNKENLLSAFSDFLEKHFSGSRKEDDVKTENVAKAVNTEKQLFTAVVLRPDVPDAHGDIYDSETVEKACHDFYEYCGKGNLQHLVAVDSIQFVENWIAKEDMKLGDGMVYKGDWVATAKIKDEEIWKMCKEGKFTGFSVGCLATTEKIND